MIIFGIIGAILTIIIFSRKRSFRLNPTITYLLAGAILTAIHLPSIYLQSILVDGFGLGVFNTNDIACREHNYLLYVTTVPTISFPCWAAFDQYASTSREASFRNRWSSMRVVRLAICGTILFWTIVYIPIIFVSRSIDGVCVMIDSPITKFNDYVLTPLVYTVMPLSVILIFTLGTIRNLRAIDLAHRHDRLTKQIRRMLIPQLIVLGISGVPFGIQSIYFNLTSKIDKDAVRLATEHLLVQIIRLFYHCNFVCAFYIYLCMSSEVRKAFKKLVYKYVPNHQIRPTDVSGTNSMTLQAIKSTKVTI